MPAPDHPSNRTGSLEVAAPALTRRGPRHRAEDLQRFTALLQFVPDATLVVDGTRHIRSVNHQVEELYGYAAKELLGQPVELLIAEHLRPVQRQRLVEFAGNFHAAVAGVPWSGRRKDGSEFPAEVRLGPLSLEGGEELIVVSLHDISDLQWAHDAQVATQAANQDLQALQSIFDTALSHLSQGDLLTALLERITDILQVDNAAVLLVDAAGETLTVQAVRGLLEPVAPRVRIPVGQGFAGRIAATGSPVVVDDITTFPVFNPSFREQLHSLAGVPLVLGDQVLGVLHIGTVLPRHFTDSDVHLLQQVADRMALAIDRARLYASEQQARCDAEAALARAQMSETRFLRLMDAGIAGIVVGDTTQVIEANDAYLRMLGYTRDDLEAGRLRGAVLSPPQEQELTRQMVQQALQTGESVLQEKEYIRKDGSRVPVLVGIVLVQRDPVRLVSIVLDLTEQKRLEHEREAARVEAEQQAAQLEAIFEAMADGVVVFDAAGRLARENAAQRRLLGIDTAPPDVADLTLPERLALFAAQDEQGRPLGLDEGPLPRALRGEILSGTETMDIRSRTLDGREVELSVSAAPLRDRDGHLTGAVAVFRDQTEQKQLERERAAQAEQLDRLFESIADGLLLYNTEGKVVRSNVEARRILGLDAAPDAYAQQSLPDRLQHYEAYDDHGHRLAFEDFPAVPVLRGQVTGAAAREIRLRTLDGHELELYVRAEPLRDEAGRLTGVVTVLHDQTAEKRLTRQEEEAHAQKLAAERVAEQMSAFLATAAHDIRSPLTVAAARVQLAVKAAERLAAALDVPVPTLAVSAEPPKLLAAEMRESLQRAYASMDQLKRQVNLLFDVTQAQSQQLVLELAPVDLRALVEEQVAALQVGVHGHRLQVQVPANAVLVEADADRLDQVLANFVSNALKYSPANRPVTVGVSVEEQEAVVRVTDQGPGIPLDEQGRIWDPFYRSPEVPLQPGNQTEKGSLGLGLSICKQLIELHPGGRIGLESAVGKGSTFWFRLPLAS
jgi:PAS domain S-box-containing protein